MNQKSKLFLAQAAAIMLIFTLSTGHVLAAAPTTGVDNSTEQELNITKEAGYVTGTSNADGGVAEIVSFDETNSNAWVVNGQTGKLDIVNIPDVNEDPGVDALNASQEIDVKEVFKENLPDGAYGDMTSVVVDAEDGYAAIALQHADYKENGGVGFLNLDGEKTGYVTVGVQPDMVTTTPDGKVVLTANEGEPRDGYTAEGAVDPKGSVSKIEVNEEDPSQSTVTTMDFSDFDDQREDLVKAGVILAQGQNPSTDLEPEYIATTNDTAYVALQEANAIAVVDLKTNNITKVLPLGFKDLSLEENAIDLLKDETYDPKTYPNVVCAYMPDGIAVYEKDGKTYLLTANEGDSREWGDGDNAYSNEKKVTLQAADGTEAKKVVVIDPVVTDGLPEGKDVLFGSRSFSIFEVGSDALSLVYDSGNAFEKITAEKYPDYFNASNDDNEKDSRSRKKGPEPENITVGEVNGKHYAFVGLERIGGIMAFDITDPKQAKYVNYINTRDFDEDPGAADAADPTTALKSDVAPEGLAFVPAAQSPTKRPMLLAAYEVSGTVGVFDLLGKEETPQPGDGETPGATDGETPNAADGETPGTPNGGTQDAPRGNATPSLQSGEVPTSKDHKDPNAAGKPQPGDGELAPSTTRIAPQTGDASLISALVGLVASAGAFLKLDKKERH